MNAKRLLLPLALAALIPIVYLLRGADPDAEAPLPVAAPFTIERIPLNQATAEDLTEVPGIGTRFAEDILTRRPPEGFTSWDEVEKVRGVGPARLRLLQDHFSLSDGESDGEPAEASSP